MDTKLLIIDDDVNICGMLKIYFENEGYKVKTANDGIEGFNSHPRHDSRNDIAMAWAKKYDLQMISGSDAHRPQDVAISGIRTKEIVKTSEQLVEVLRNRDYEMIIV